MTDKEVTCWGCKYADISEDGHEWLVCACKLNNNKLTNFNGCDKKVEKE